MAKIEREEDQELLELMRNLRETLKATGGKELLPDEDWLTGQSSHRETGGAAEGADQGTAESVDQFIIKRRKTA